MNKHTVFVYGSLLSELNNHHFLKGAKFLGKHELLMKASMISLGAYPALMKCEDQYVIHGESYEVDDKGLERLDYLEGHPNYYQREQLEDGTWTYYLTEGCVPDVPIPVMTGDWREYLSERSAA